MKKDRRAFLRSGAVFSAGMAAFPITTLAAGPEAGIEKKGAAPAQVFNMCGYRAPKIETIRIGFVGLGNRGSAAVSRVNFVEGVQINGLCDIVPEKAAKSAAALGKIAAPPRLYSGNAEAWKKLCESPDIDVVYIATPWNLRVPVASYAMAQGKHVALEVGNAESVEECWQLVNASEKNRRHCIFLENCCYDFFELLTLNMARQGFFGEIVHCEGAYIHQLVASLFDVNARYDLWRLKENVRANGNLYPTHGLGPICQIMNINRGDQMDYLVSMSSNDFTMKGLEEEADKKDPAHFSPFLNSRFSGNMNTSVIRTMKGKTIMLQHDVSSRRVYSRIHLVSGTKGSAMKYPLPGRISTGQEEYLKEEEMKKLEEQYTLPIVTRFGEMAKKVGGHGGMDFLMDWRWIDCLHNGLPIDSDVYDAALWTAIGPLSVQSVANRSAPVNIPDFTGGSWKKNEPVNISIDHGNLTGIREISGPSQG